MVLSKKQFERFRGRLQAPYLADERRRKQKKKTNQETITPTPYELLTLKKKVRAQGKIIKKLEQTLEVKENETVRLRNQVVRPECDHLLTIEKLMHASALALAEQHLRLEGKDVEASCCADRAFHDSVFVSNEDFATITRMSANYSNMSPKQWKKLQLDTDEESRKFQKYNKVLIEEAQAQAAAAEGEMKSMNAIPDAGKIGPFKTILPPFEDDEMNDWQDHGRGDEQDDETTDEDSDDSDGGDDVDSSNDIQDGNDDDMDDDQSSSAGMSTNSEVEKENQDEQ